ncbi:MAG: uroporphyrinogen decarboxylase family protein [Chloroflexota bacterium]|nr:uroporphyrinogen decarboxylase [Chloroflexota bacterium]
MAKNDKWRRVEAALSGASVDRIPFAFWRHFPELDHNPDKLVQATLAQHHRYEMDYLKVMFRSSWGVEDWGSKSDYYNPVSGSQKITHYPIHASKDWYKLKPLKPTEGVLGEQLYVLRKLAERLEGDAPILATLFAPAMLATHLSGQTAFFQHLREDPAAVQAGLEVITETLLNFGLACLENGADGLFYAIQEASRKLLSEQEYRQIGQTYDLPVLERFYHHSSFIMLHAHGEELMFDQLLTYPFHALNWYDRQAGGPTLKELRSLTNRALAGGIDHEATLLRGSPEELGAELEDAIAQVSRRGFLLAPGCGVPITVSEENLAMLKEAAFRLG